MHLLLLLVLVANKLSYCKQFVSQNFLARSGAWLTMYKCFSSTLITIQNLGAVCHNVGGAMGPAHFYGLHLVL